MWLTLFQVLEAFETCRSVLHWGCYDQGFWAKKQERVWRKWRYVKEEYEDESISVFGLQITEVVHERYRVWDITVEVILRAISALT